ncbi:TIGR02677 family protein [Thiohalomonas denitrificans]|uniref:TIGR02677 family protein n=1 Tax=Thiohalomonas denitrificans TaxID=415747 RepID=UPI000B8048D5|nr:TIGR02677 family protein [Thiohalomonas denitrificans]
MPFTAFAHINAEKSVLYRRIMAVFADAKAHFIVHLRPEDVAERLGEGVAAEEVQAALGQLANWGNLQAEPDTSRVTSVEDFYRARFLYQITREGEAAEQALRTFEEVLGRRGALQSVALEEIRTHMRALLPLAQDGGPDSGRVTLLLRDLSRVFADLAENARAFMAGLGRSIDLREGEREAFLLYKERLIDYLERFLGELVVAAAEINALIRQLDGPPIERLLRIVAERDARDAAPDLEAREDDGGREFERALANWRAHWEGLTRWFVGSAGHPSQEALLRSRARKAITQLMETVVRLNERRLGRSDRSADFRVLARWFAECEDDADAHRLWRAAFGLAPARHLTVDPQTLAAWEERPVPAGTPWAAAPPLAVSPRLRATGRFQRRGAPAKVRRHREEKAELGRQIAREAEQTRRARARLATGKPTRLSEFGELDADSFGLFLRLLGEVLSSAAGPEAPIETVTGDGSLRVVLEPLEADSEAALVTPLGTLRGRDYRICITDLEG